MVLSSMPFSSVAVFLMHIWHRVEVHLFTGLIGIVAHKKSEVGPRLIVFDGFKEANFQFQAGK